MDVQVRLTPKVLFRAIRSVADAIGRSCEARMMDEVIAASAEEDALAPANVELRDYFAGQALVALFSGEANPRVGRDVEPYNSSNSHREWSAMEAYALADAMLAARGAA
jgi:hypothetical protein